MWLEVNLPVSDAAPVVRWESHDARDHLSTSQTILLDAHVHLHRCFDPGRFLDSARANFQRAAQRTGRSNSVGCLWLTDPPEERSFRRLSRGGGVTSPALDRWSLAPTGEATSLVAQHESGDRLFLLAGRQIATRERFEVLALGTELDLPPHRSLDDTIAGVRDSGAIAVIPWGFGKWWFRRRRMLAAALASAPATGLFVGDNAGRARLIPRSTLFQLAASRGIYNLPGSDPLPLRWEIRKPGSLGCVLEGPLDLSRPTESLIRILRGLRAQPPLFGGLDSLAGFVRSQVGLRLRRRPMAPAELAGGA
jgi:hypothetical protein